MIQIENLFKTYETKQGGEPHTALKDINITIEDGAIFGIIGQSGAGKSTLVRCINLLERPSSGRIVIDGRDVTHLKGKELLEYRSQVGMIFQNFSLFQQRTVLQNVMFPLELKKENKSKARSRALELLELVGLGEKASKYPSQLSGGQQQRVAIARALATRPSIILADEPTGNLDSKTTQEVIGLIKRTSHLFKQTIVMITHNEDIAQLADRIIKIEDGKLRENNDE